MARSRAKTKAVESGPRSLELYEALIRLLVLDVLTYGRPLAGLAPLADGERLTAERIDAEAEAAERFVAPRVWQTSLGYLSLALTEEEWSVFAETHQAPFRDQTPPTAYDRVKAAAVAANKTRADPDDDELTGHRVVKIGRRGRRTQRGGHVVRG